MRTVSLYAVLVGLPLLGLLAILRAGQALTPPPSIGGEWVLEGSEAPAACLGLEGQGFSFTVAQSGLRSSITLGGDGPVLDVTFQGDSLISRHVVASAGCADGPPTLRATLVGRGGEPALAGVLHRPGCDSCAPFAFRAARRGAPETSR